jgi:DNA-binding response OmpR family regulator
MPASDTSNPTPETSELDIKSVLLLDDDTDLADTLKALLESHNYVVTTVGNGAEGLREVMEMDFDLILCDLLMPGMPGDMFYLAVSKAKPHLKKRFIFITGHSGNPRVESFLKEVDADVLFKPVGAEDLLEMISLVLRRQSAQ